MRLPYARGYARERRMPDAAATMPTCLSRQVVRRSPARLKVAARPAAQRRLPAPSTIFVAASALPDNTATRQAIK